MGVAMGHKGGHGAIGVVPGPVSSPVTCQLSPATQPQCQTMPMPQNIFVPNIVVHLDCDDQLRAGGVCKTKRLHVQSLNVTLTLVFTARSMSQFVSAQRPFVQVLLVRSDSAVFPTKKTLLEFDLRWKSLFLETQQISNTVLQSYIPSFLCKPIYKQ